MIQSNRKLQEKTNSQDVLQSNSKSWEQPNAQEIKLLGLNINLHDNVMGSEMEYSANFPAYNP